MQARSIRDIAAAVRGRRIELGLTQADLAARARVSRKWIYEFESGKPRAELAHVIRVLESLGLVLNIGSSTRTRAPKRSVDLDSVIRSHRAK